MQHKIVLIGFLLILLLIQSASAQDSLSKTEILEKMKLFRHYKHVMRRELTTDSVYFFASGKSLPEYNYVTFHKLVKDKKDRRNGTIYQFYFLNDNLIFIVQGTRNRKHFSEYYLNQGRVFWTELDNSLPVLTQDVIDQLRTTLLAIRNRSRE